MSYVPRYQVTLRQRRTTPNTKKQKVIWTLYKEKNIYDDRRDITHKSGKNMLIHYKRNVGELASTRSSYKNEISVDCKHGHIRHEIMK